ncbi:S1-like domain-containing protein [Sphaceloma murrayae]|uniref:Alpha N-terminal protein methyltransferase 1 n=1 Tax=Sphaceloma murrayae TaxID=2082308 RepID=A0A2K1R3I1_9PEZI|nr:S1-like domain-containing protein [Sphaceloma murrayae]
MASSTSPPTKKPRLAPPVMNPTTPPADSPTDTGEDTYAPADSHINHSAAIAYWSSTPATVSGVLGGYPGLSRTDIQGSANFLTKLRRGAARARNSNALGGTEDGKEEEKAEAFPKPSERLRRVVDCGAGIGRISVGLLGKMARRVDVVEPVTSFCEVVRREGREGGLKGTLGRVWEVGLEGWRPFGEGQEGSSAGTDKDDAKKTEGVEEQVANGAGAETTNQAGAETMSAMTNDGDELDDTASGIPDTQLYDLIWNQWCLGQLTDKQLTEYLARSIAWLSKAGFIIVKENLSNHPEGRDIFDEEDSSVTRTQQKFESIFEAAGLRIVKTEVQRGFPKELYPVRIWGLQPKH